MTEKPRAMRDALLERIWQAMGTQDDIYFVTADFGSPVLDKIRADHPTRFMNVGVAEQNLINVTAGLALEGFKVFSYAIAPFITMRCLEQVRVSLALLSEVRPMNVNLIGVGAGYSYVVSGPTHQCYEDLTVMRAMPNMQVLSPADHTSSAALFDRCIQGNGIKYLRLDAQVLPIVDADRPYDATKGFRVLGEGTDIVLVATGYMVHTAQKVAQNLSEQGRSVGLIDLVDFSGLDVSALKEILEPAKSVATLEEGFRARGGLDALIADILRENLPGKPHLNLGVTGGYRFELGTRQELHEEVGIGEHAVLNQINGFLTAY